MGMKECRSREEWKTRNPINSLTNVFTLAAQKSSWLHPWRTVHQVRRFVRHLALLMHENHSARPENVGNGPNRAKARAGVP